MRRHISILGSTGSIGRQSLDVIAACGMTVAALTANRDAALVEAQARRFKPELAVMMDGAAAGRSARPPGRHLRPGGLRAGGASWSRHPGARRHGDHRRGGRGGPQAHPGRR